MHVPVFGSSLDVYSASLVPRSALLSTYLELARGKPFTFDGLCDPRLSFGYPTG
jgi:hypothetical protein